MLCRTCCNALGIASQSPTREGFYNPYIFSIRNYHIPFTLRIRKAMEDFPILHGYFQSLMDFREIHYIDQKCYIVRVVT